MEQRFDLRRIEGETFVERIEYLRETKSTNDLALERLRDGQCHPPLLVLADQQTRGRGRGDNAWWSDAGALTFSLVIDTSGMASLPGGVFPISLVAAVAVCRAIGKLFSGIDVRLKWPNDVLLGRRKVCGILTEVPARPADRMVIGVGINVNNSLADAPIDVQQRAASLSDVAGRQVDLTEVLINVLRQFDALVRDYRRGDLRAGQACAPWCALTGRRVSLKLGSRRVAGVCRGIDDSGALIIAGDEEYHCMSGVIETINWER
jgi:BirA family biotin operon repressor/biotin-[acetyl-CoA-carboxylase] ligase